MGTASKSLGNDDQLQDKIYHNRPLDWRDGPLNTRQKNPNDPESPYIITVGEEATSHTFLSRLIVKEYSSLTDEQRRILHEACQEFSDACNIEIHLVPSKYSNSADIRIAQGVYNDSLKKTFSKKKKTPYACTDRGISGYNTDIVINKERPYLPEFCIRHELFHAITGNHDHVGASYDVTTDDTIMSYNVGSNRDFHLREDDKAVLVRLFGPPKGKGKVVIRTDDDPPIPQASLPIVPELTPGKGIGAAAIGALGYYMLSSYGKVKAMLGAVEFAAGGWFIGSMMEKKLTTYTAPSEMSTTVASAEKREANLTSNTLDFERALSQAKDKASREHTPPSTFVGNGLPSIPPVNPSNSRPGRAD